MQTATSQSEDATSFTCQNCGATTNFVASGRGVRCPFCGSEYVIAKPNDPNTPQPEALIPLMKRTIENGFELTGPIARGDRQTVDAHLEAIGRRVPDLKPMYEALAAVTTVR